MRKSQKFEVYVITSPSGKRYVGLTKAGAKYRWKSHCQRAKRLTSDHPFHRAIRKYGKETFTLHVYEVTQSEETAKQAEIDFIRAFRTTEKEFGYNISKGGDYDGVSGAAAMRERLKDPAFREVYLKLLSDTKKANDWTDYALMSSARAAWRRENPRIAYKNSRRCARISAKLQGNSLSKGEDVVGTYGRLWINSVRVRDARKAYFARIAKQKTWDEMTSDRKSEICAKMSASNKEKMKDPKNYAQAVANMSKARDAVDRTKQAAGASAGLKAYWARVKSDPVAYKELMDAKRIKLSKALLRHYQRRAEESFFG